MQRHYMQHQINAGFGQIKRFVVGHDNRIWELCLPEIRETGHNRDGLKGSVNLFESFLNLVSNDVVQEKRIWNCAGAIAQKGGAVGKFIHNASFRVQTCRCKGSFVPFTLRNVSRVMWRPRVTLIFAGYAGAIHSS